MNCLDDKVLPKEIDLFLWGHEHDCYTTFYSLKTGRGVNQFIYQPGSSVATSLGEGESLVKHYGIISYSGELHKPVTLERAIPIRSQRGMLYHQVLYEDLLFKAEKIQKLTPELKEIHYKDKHHEL